MSRIINFGAGPSALPIEILEEMQKEMLNYKNTGMSICELSHRSKEFMGLLDNVEKDLRQLLSIPHNYKVLFMSGGGTGQFAAIPLNLGSKNKPCAYLVNGTWSRAAANEAKKFCQVEVTDTIDKLTNDYSYVYVCTNETVDGTFFDPTLTNQIKPNQILVADMSSELLTRVIDISKYGLIFAGCQKNIGIAGVSVVIIREDLLTINNTIAKPAILDYNITNTNKSMLNTPPTFSIYVLSLMLKWSNQFGITKLEELSRSKAELLYNCLEKYPTFYVLPVEKEFRSRTNIVFKTKSNDIDKKFINQAENEGLIGLAGHRSVGGMRASLYNAISIDDVIKLVEFIENFAKNNLYS